MKNISDKADNTAGATGQLTAIEYNDRDSELENIVTGSGQTLTPGAGDDTEQLGKAVATYAGRSSNYNDAGVAANAHVISDAKGMQFVPALADLLRISFVPNFTNVAGNVNIDYFGLGTKRIVLPTGSNLDAGVILANEAFDIQYDTGTLGGAWIALPRAGGGVTPVSAEVLVNWIEPNPIGSTFNVLPFGPGDICTLSPTRVATISSDLGGTSGLRFYDWDGSVWAFGALTLLAGSNPSICALNETDVCVVYGVGGAVLNLEVYRLAGSVFSLLGAGTTLAGTVAEVGAITPGIISVWEDGDVNTFSWNGAVFAFISTTAIGGSNGALSVTPLSATDMAVTRGQLAGGNNGLWVFRWNGATWVALAPVFPLGLFFQHNMTAINTTDVMIISRGEDILRYYHWDAVGLVWNVLQGDHPLAVGVDHKLTPLNGVDWAGINMTTDLLTTYRNLFAVGLPPRELSML